MVMIHHSRVIGKGPHKTEIFEKDANKEGIREF